MVLFIQAKQRFKKLFVGAALEAWSDNECLSRGAAVSFYTATTLVPICGVMIGVMALWFGQDLAVQRFAFEMARLIGQSATSAVSTIAQQSSAWNQDSGIRTLVSLGLTFFGATTVLAELRSAFAAIWQNTQALAPPPKNPIVNEPAWQQNLFKVWKFVRTRVLALTLLVSLTFVLLVSTLLTTLASLLVEAALRWSGQHSTWLAAISVKTVGLATSTLVTALAMWAIFRLLTPTRLSKKLLLHTTLIATFGFIIGRLVIAWYIANAPALDAYGTAASLVVLMLWLYYAVQIVLLSACWAAVTMKQENFSRKRLT